MQGACGDGLGLKFLVTADPTPRAPTRQGPGSRKRGFRWRREDKGALAAGVRAEVGRGPKRKLRGHSRPRGNCPRLTHLRLRIPRFAGKSAGGPAVVRVTDISRQARSHMTRARHVARRSDRTAVSIFLPQKEGGNSPGLGFCGGESRRCRTVGTPRLSLRSSET